MFQDCLLYYSAFFDDVFVPCTPSVAAEGQSYVAAMTVNYIKECKEFNFQLPFKLPVEPPLGSAQSQCLLYSVYDNYSKQKNYEKQILYMA